MHFFLSFSFFFLSFTLFFLPPPTILHFLLSRFPISLSLTWSLAVFSLYILFILLIHSVLQHFFFRYYIRFFHFILHSRTCMSPSRVFANGPEDRCSIPGGVIPKTQKMVFNTPLLNTQHYKLRIKGKVDQSREKSCTFPYTSLY